MSNEPCVVCRKPTIYDKNKAQRVCVNKKCDFGKHFKKSDYQDPDSKWNFWDVVFQIGFLGGWALILFALFGDHHGVGISDNGVIVMFIIGIVSVLTMVIGGLLIADTIYHSHKDWETRRKMYWWISWMVPRGS